MNNHLKTICCGIFALSVGFALSQSTPKAAQAKPKGITVMVDQNQVTFEGTQPQAVKGRIMVPLRGIFEKIGAYVEYDAANHTIAAKRGNEEVDLRMGSRIATKNGAEILMEVPPSIIGGSTMVPLRFVAEALGAKVGFDQPTNTVSVTTDSSGVQK